MNTHGIKWIPVVAAAAVASLLPVSGFGETEYRNGYPQTVWRTVYIGDLDLTTTADRQRLGRRLERAAWKVCSVVEPTAEVGAIRHGQCIHRLSSNASAEVYAALPERNPEMLVVGRDPK